MACGPAGPVTPRVLAVAPGPAWGDSPGSALGSASTLCFHDRAQADAAPPPAARCLLVLEQEAFPALGRLCEKGRAQSQCGLVRGEMRPLCCSGPFGMCCKPCG